MSLTCPHCGSTRSREPFSLENVLRCIYAGSAGFQRPNTARRCLACGKAFHCEHPEPGHCSQCGYDLRGIASDRCPECGAHVASSDRTAPLRPIH